MSDILAAPDMARPVRGLLAELIAEPSHVRRAFHGVPVFEGVRLFEAVTLSLSVWPNGDLALMNIETDCARRGEGFGRKAMQAVLAAADRHGVNVRLYPRAHSRSPLNSQQLRAWYRRLGFQRIPGGMRRQAEPRI